jgi:hypothetical protein
MRRSIKRTVLAAIAFVLTALTFFSTVSAKRFTDWSAPVNAELIPCMSSELNTPFNDGCPYQSPDGQSLFLASNRQPGALGRQDIWISDRQGNDGPWGTLVNVGAPINSAYNDYCPSPSRGHRLFFVSDRPGGCGGADIYVTRLGPNGWEEPQNVGCQINNAADEASPSLFEDDEGNAILYFSSTRPGGFDEDAEPAGTQTPTSASTSALRSWHRTSTPNSATSAQNVRHDGREIVFDSKRPGAIGQDIFTAKRESTNDGWSEPVNLAVLNNALGTRPGHRCRGTG